MYLVSPVWTQGNADRLGGLLIRRDEKIFIPHKGPGRRSIENAIAKLQQSQDLPPSSLLERRRSNQALRERYSNGRLIR